MLDVRYKEDIRYQIYKVFRYIKINICDLASGIFLRSAILHLISRVLKPTFCLFLVSSFIIHHSSLSIAHCASYKIFPFEKKNVKGALLHIPDKDTWAYFYLPPTEHSALNTQRSVPLVLVLPILGGQNLWIEKKFAFALTKKGIAAVIVIGPEQFHRRSFMDISSGKLFLGRNPEILSKNFLQAKSELKSLISFIQEEDLAPPLDRVNTEQIGILGISLGGILGSLTFAQDKRIKCAAFLLAGADCAMILAKGSLTRKIIKTLGLDYDALYPMLKDLDVERIRRTSGDNITDKRKTMIIHAIWDSIIPKTARKKLEKAFPASKITKLPAGHFTSIVFIGYIRAKAANFFKMRLAEDNTAER
ncbi:hypothetical protein ACFL6Y_01505 [Elusimicrobiota bacterium]